MSEADKAGHILKGISEDGFQYLMARDSRTVESIIEACRRLNETKRARIPATTSTRLPSLPLRLQIPVTKTLRTVIRDIIKEELRIMFPDSATLLEETTAATRMTLRDVIREELSAAAPSISAITMSPRLHADSAPRLLSQPAAQTSFQPKFQRPMSTEPPRTTYSNAQWTSTVRSRPTCFHCGIRGHIARFCRRRIAEERGDTYRFFGRSSYNSPAAYPKYPYDEDVPTTGIQASALALALPTFFCAIPTIP
ncbi:hypothetical protein HPB47_016712 [Ixodes persulcatus]|uniref:Uncharacterized protein n=1 Tax=Ixodes persulcatus TaxID=34615 RepID=A0AC60QQ63_IXOPE|nr:hypothetical protein HPB47_016712 [Ixodes persulcatus]